jgi:hypothetical protein
MTWARATVFVRLICLAVAIGSFGMAWRLTKLGASGAEDIPPPFTLAAGLAGIGFSCVAISGRYPRPRD